MLLIHGDRDELIPVQALFQAAQALAALEVPVEWHLSQGVGHGIDQEGLRHGGEFLAAAFRPQEPAGLNSQPPCPIRAQPGACIRFTIPSRSL